MKKPLFRLLGSVALAFFLSAPVLAQGSPWTQTTFAPADVTALNGKSVFFVHNSVGSNIVDGLRAVAPSLTITNAITSGGQPSATGFTDLYMNNYAASTGNPIPNFNRRPLDKVAYFETLMERGGRHAQIAFLKFCFMDFDGDMPAWETMRDAYSGMVNRLQTSYPNVTFVHITAPLYVYNQSWHNNKQHNFNNWLRATYGGKVFDLAAITSINANGTPAATAQNPSPGAPTLSLDWAVGVNNSHLNANGGRRVASGLISFLARVSLSGNPPPPPPPEFGPSHDYTGQWIKTSPEDEKNWGLTVLQNFPGDARYIFVPWYTYDSSGRAAWYIFQGPATGYGDWTAKDTFEANVYRYSGPNWGEFPYNNSRITNVVAGTAKLTFTSAKTARFEYAVDGSSRTINLRKFE
ncbi:MAG: hypothetical protein FWC38_07685 [Proteobacteria bacterium]|nr:hypothetical protein [Pseudomonadota bacterium]MCL2308082.1 hypothetical protein [Pseudomonadota bacterium]